MDSLKEKDNPAPNPAKRPRIEVDEELMRQMIAGQAPLDSKVVRRIPEPEEENTDAPEGNTSAPTAEKTNVDTQTTTVKATHDFVEFVNCFALSDYCYSKEKSLKILQEEILRCKMLPEE